MAYYISQTVRAACVFSTTTGTVYDPSTIIAKYKIPAGTITTLTYGVDAGLVKDSVGNYHVDINAATDGAYEVRWVGTTGTVSAVQEDRFQVLPTTV